MHGMNRRNLARGLAIAGFLLGAGFFCGPNAPAWAADAEMPDAETPGVHFIELGAFVVPVINGSQVTRHVSLAISVEVTGDEKKAEVEHMLPRVKDVVLRELHKHMSRRRDPDTVQDLLKLKRKLRKAGNGLLGEGMLNDVLIENTLERKIL